LDKEGFGKYVLKDKRNGPAKDYFFRPSPEGLTAEEPIFKLTKISLEEYAIKYKVVDKMSASEKAVCKSHHPHWEVINTLFSDVSEDDSQD